MEFLIKLSLRKYRSGKPITDLIRFVVLFILIVAVASMWPSIYITNVKTLAELNCKDIHRHGTGMAESFCTRFC